MKTGVVMDPISGIKIHKDSTFAMMLESQRRGHTLLYMEPSDLFVHDGVALASMQPVTVRDDPSDWFSLGVSEISPLSDLDLVLMRRDPPFDMDYVYLTYVLDLAQSTGTLVINRPQSLRDANEKFFVSNFPQCTVPFAITRDSGRILEFVTEHGPSVVKPLDGMGGESISSSTRATAT